MSFPDLHAASSRYSRAQEIVGETRVRQVTWRHPHGAIPHMSASSAAAAPLNVTKFFVPLQLLHLAQKINRCYEAKHTFHNLSRTQFLFELDVLRAAINHPLRALRREEASVVLLPILAVVSKQVGDNCEKIDMPHSHVQRLRLMHTLVQNQIRWQGIFNGGTLVRPRLFIIPCTCVMQKAQYGPQLFDLLANHSHSVVAMSHARRSPPESLSRVHVVTPYHSPPPFDTAAATRGSKLCEPRSESSGGTGGGGGLPLLISFAGSPETTRQPTTCVRHHILALAREAPSRIAAHATTRHAVAGASQCASSGTCVDGFHHSPRFEKNESAKARMARMFARSRFCLVPEGDSPESSRLFDAVHALCTPLVITMSSEGLFVPRSRYWREATLVLNSVTFMRMDATALEAYLEAAEASPELSARRCRALRSLRADLSGARMLAHTVRIAANLSAGWRPDGVIADFDVLQPPLPTPLLLGLLRRSMGRVAARRPAVGDIVAVRPNIFNQSHRVERATVAAIDDVSGTIEVPVHDLRESGRGPARLPNRTARILVVRPPKPANKKGARRVRPIETDPVCLDDYEALALSSGKP